MVIGKRVLDQIIKKSQEGYFRSHMISKDIYSIFDNQGVIKVDVLISNY